MSRFIQKESYKHLFAKNLLKRWFLEQNSQRDFCSVAQFEWRSNYGVFTELEFYETSDPYYFELSYGLKKYIGHDVNNVDNRGVSCLDWFDVSIDRGKILFVPDVAIFHKGVPGILIEVVHTNPVPIWKIDRIKKFFNGFHILLFEIQAEEILRYDKSIVPTYLSCNQLI